MLSLPNIHNAVAKSTPMIMQALSPRQPYPNNAMVDSKERHEWWIENSRLNHGHACMHT